MGICRVTDQGQTVEESLIEILYRSKAAYRNFYIWECDMLNRLNHEAFELICHDQQCWRQQWDRTPVFNTEIAWNNNAVRDDGFWKYSWAHTLIFNHRIMPFFKQCTAWRSEDHTHRDFTIFLETFDDIKYCKLWDIQSHNFTFRFNLLLKLFWNCFKSHSNRDWFTSSRNIIRETSSPPE